MQDAQPSFQNDQAEARRTPLPLRNDTVLGVCEAIGEDLGFHPNWLRVLFALSVYFSPAAVIGTYLALGAIVAFTRWLYPDPRFAAATAAPVAAQAPAANAENEQYPLPLAA